MRGVKDRMLTFTSPVRFEGSNSTCKTGRSHDARLRKYARLYRREKADETFRQRQAFFY